MLHLILLTLLGALPLDSALFGQPDGEPAAFVLGVEPLADAALVRGLQEARLSAPGTSLGSYGQFDLIYTPTEGVRGLQGRADIKRLVLFVGHRFGDRVRSYAEVEWSHLPSCSSCAGALSIAQGFVDWDLTAALTLRTGLLLVPVGIVNQWHEPPVFHGVSRASVERVIIPTLWRELGAGVTGRLAPFWRYELYAMVAPDALRLSRHGLRDASSAGLASPANGWMLAGRLEAEPRAGFVLGLAGVGGDMGDVFRLSPASRTSWHLPLYGAALDARWRRHGLEARALATAFWLPNAGNVATMTRLADGQAALPAGAGAVPTLSYGAYAEVAYDVLRWLGGSSQQVLPFVRVETYDVQARVAAGQVRDAAAQTVETAVGLSYRPLAQLVFKADGRFLQRPHGADGRALEMGMGYMF